MNKEIIYIDTEDDITAIIGKVKGADEKIVALVPPKRIGVLQSAVNLRLLARAAKQASKRLVIITNNDALTALAAAAMLPVAKNLQSKPEIPEIPALDIDDGNDVIDGARLPVGDHAKQAESDVEIISPRDQAIEQLAAFDEPVKKAAPPAQGQAPTRAKVKKGVVPNFNKFRKKFMIVSASAVVLIGVLVWAFVFAPSATVVISARTSDLSMNKPVVVGPDLTTSVSNNTIKATAHEIKKSVSVDVVATGTKDVGETATGTVRFTSDSYSSLQDGISIPEGTSLTSSGGKVYTTDAAVQLSLDAGNSGSVGVTAAERGASYNGASGSVSGAPSRVSASFVGATSGGTDRTVKVVTKDDVERAQVKLDEQDDEKVVEELKAQFAGSQSVIESSFKADKSDVKASPSVGDEAEDGKGKLSGEVVYRLVGVEKSELSTYLTSYFENEIDDEATQRIYNDGSSEVTFTNVSEKEGSYNLNLSAAAKVGPKIEDDQVKELAKGKRYGEVQSALVAIQGVDNVDVKFPWFWVRTVPNNVEKIKVEFSLDESN